VAVDATGLAQGAVSTFFVRRIHHHGQKLLPSLEHVNRARWLLVAALNYTDSTVQGDDVLLRYHGSRF
jgi:hypothetical protein